ncbi:MAG: DNA ligase D [Chitinophagales bacterium]|nr:DNA ligase D [Chitinophagales bacterium]
MAKLQEYNKKRNFKQTAEPTGKVKSGKGDLVFVVQKHDATRLHYDFRLEAGGVLISWAIPKEPVHDPSVKRLAIHVEDHPFDYLHFEGTIPEGNYGAGTVMVWDTGTYHYVGTESREQSEKAMAAGMKKGHVTVILEGSKLKGEFTLVRIKSTGEDKDQWLFFKVDDEHTGRKIPKKDVSVLSGRDLEQISKGNVEWHSHKGKVVKPEAPTADLKKELTAADLKGAPKSPMPKKIKPMLAKLVDEPFNHDDWLFEIKWDGYRAVAEIQKGKVNLYSRNLKPFNDKYASVVDSLSTFNFDAVLDGEVVIFDKEGKPSFQALQNYDDNPEGELTYIVFDMLWYEGKDLRQLPLSRRKQILRKVLPDVKGIKYSDHVIGDGNNFFQAAVKMGLEGVMAKKCDSHYEVSKRTDLWQKIKNIQSQEALICGYSAPKGSRKHFGSLILGVHQGKQLVYIGNVGTGFNDKMLKELKERFKPLEVKQRTVEKYDESERGVTWLKPELICEVQFTEWTETGHLRHPSFIGLRDDKKPAEIKKEHAHDAGLMLQEASNQRIHITNKDKLYFPEDGYTKEDVVGYYDSIAHLILPYLKDRPESLRRNPNGILDEGFFQKDVAGQVPDWIMTKKISSKHREGPIEYMFCQDKETLLFMANWGCIELNPWSSRVPHLENPDYIIFDLDPLDIDFKQVVRVAIELRKVLEALDVTAYIKTSGGKGIHAFIPAGAQYTYDQTQQFAKLIELHINAQLPDITSLERMPAKRKGKVYLDFLQNAMGKTMASVYSVRPKKGATVSTPLKWDELTDKLSPSLFTIKTAPERFAKVGDLWEGILDQKVDLMKLLERFNSKFG